MLHCKNSRPEIFQAFPLFIKNEVKVSINLERTIWHTMGNQSWNQATRRVQTVAAPSSPKTCARSGVKETVTSRPLYPSNDSIVLPQPTPPTPTPPPLTALRDSLHSPPMSSWDVGCPLLLLRYSVYFSIWCLFLHRHQRGEALQLHVSYHCTFCNKFNSVQIWPWGTKTLNTKCAL